MINPPAQPRTREATLVHPFAHRHAIEPRHFSIVGTGGQRQRISIARELYKHTEVLIFDEATSALDSETERIIQENIEQLRGNYTIVLIAHRLSTIKEADTIYLLEKGKVTASGSFDEMVNKSTRFQKMVSLQGI